MNKFSIGVPVYNQVTTIGKTILSILEQQVPFHEVIVSDNHSTDGTSEVLKQFRGKITIVSPEAHCSITENWNFCVSRMKCDWFSLLSGDDFLYPDFSKKMLSAINANKNAVLIRGGIDMVDEKRNILSTSNLNSVTLKTSYPRNVKQQLLNPRTSFACFAARKKTWKEVNGFPVELHLAQDWGFWLLLAPHGDFIKAGTKPLTQYTNVFRNELEAKRMPLFFEDSLKIYEWIQEKGIIPLSKRKLCLLYRIRFLSFLNYFRNAPVESREKAKNAVYELGRRGGFSDVEITEKIKTGKNLRDAFFLKKENLYSKLYDMSGFLNC